MLKVHAPETHWLSPKMPELARVLNAPGVNKAEVQIGDAPDGALRVIVQCECKTIEDANAAIIKAFDVLVGDRETLVRAAPAVTMEEEFATSDKLYRGFCRLIVFNRPHLSTANAIDAAKDAAVSVASNRE